MKKKLTLIEKLDKKVINIPSSIGWAGYSFLAESFIFGPKYHPEYRIIDDINKEKGPCFLIWNHLSRRDYLFIKNITAPRKFNMVATHTEYFRSHLRPLFNVAQVIPKKICEQDMPFLKRVLKIIDQGGCIAFSPEGMSSIYGSNQPIVPGTGKFLKYFRIPVYFVKLEGAYLSSHKTNIDDRPGKVIATISKMFTPDDLKSLTGEEIDSKINEAFRHDEYEWNKKQRIKYKTKKKAATNFESLAYKCPKCGAELQMESNGDKLYCKHCGNGLTVNDYYDFVPFDSSCKIKDSLTEWVRWERRETIKEIRENPDYSFSFEAKIGVLPEYKVLKHKASSMIVGEGTFTIDHQGLHFKGTKEGLPFEYNGSFSTNHTLAIINATDAFSLFDKGIFYEFFPKVPAVGKALILTEEMHRLHFNTWKNFPWEKDLYKDYEK